VEATMELVSEYFEAENAEIITY